MPASAVDAPDVTGLIELSRDPQLDLKPVVLRVQTDLFLAAPIRDRAALEAFGALAAGLIPTVDEETALIVARKLGSCADTPPGVLTRLAERGGRIGEAVLEANPAPPVALIAAARNAGVDVEAILARRASIDEPESTEMDVPPRRGDAERLDGAPIGELVARARRDTERAGTLLVRADLAPAELAPLWLHADRQQRAAIAEAVAATATLRPCPPAQRGLGPTLTELSTARDVEGFVETLAASLGLGKEFLAAAPEAASRYDLLTLAMRAADLSESDAIYVFLTLNETVARSVERVFELAKLYRSITRATARDLIAAILGTPLPERVGTGTHQPYLGADAARPRYSAATERALERAVQPHRLRRTI